MPAHPSFARPLYLTLSVATLAGAAAAVPLILLFPPTDLAAAHARAATPFARAVTSHAVDVAGAVCTCILGAWLLALCVLALRWRSLGEPAERRSAAVHLLHEVFVIGLLLMMGTRTLDTLPRLANGGVFAWCSLILCAAAGTTGAVLFLTRAAAAARTRSGISA